MLGDQTPKVGHELRRKTVPAGDAFSKRPGRGVRPDHLDRLDRGPAHQPGALLGDPAAVHVGVGLVMLGSQPGPAGQLRRRREPGHLADLGDDTAPRVGPIPGMVCTAR